MESRSNLPIQEITSRDISSVKNLPGGLDPHSYQCKTMHPQTILLVFLHENVSVEMHGNDD